MEEERSKSKSDKKNKKRRLEQDKSNASTSDKNKVIKNSVVKTSATLLLPEKAKSNYSIQNDKNTTETFKSLFTTHKTAKNQTKNNWVTFNPNYNR